MRRHCRPLSFQSLENRRVFAALDIPETLSGAPAGTVSVPINIDTASGVRAAEIRLSYDTAVLDLVPANVTAGTVWSGASDTQVTANVDEAAGTVVIFISSANPLATAAGSLVQLGFTVASNASVGSTTRVNLTQASLNEGAINVSPAPQSGVDTTDGLITVIAAGAGDRVVGFVFSDTNSNSTVDSLEGIPGVVITLTNSSTGAQTQATTGAGGRYEFLNLTPGTYTVRQTQPIAFVEGSANELTAVLVANQVLADQNFREGGLRAQFIYNRLLTTLVQPIGSSQWNSQIARINQDAANGTVAPFPASSSATTPSTAASSTLSNSDQSALLNSSPAEGTAEADSSAFTSSTTAEGETSDELATMAMLSALAASQSSVPSSKEDDKSAHAAIDDAMTHSTW